MINPKSFTPSNEGETAALQVSEELEPHNPLAFKTTYLRAYKRGLPPSMFYEFASEIKQDSTIKSPGAVFNKKVEDYLKSKFGNRPDRLIDTPNQKEENRDRINENED